MALRLYNLTDQTLNMADIRGPIPTGMSLVTSSPIGALVGNEVRWTHISEMGPGSTRSFVYRLNTNGLGGTVRAWAGLIGPTTNTNTISQARTIAAATVRTSTIAGLGTFLVDSEGRTLYMFAIDEPNSSKCLGGCARAWPLLTVTGAPTAGSGVNASLLGTATHPEGATQVTYNGWPLYYYIRDTNVGDTNGHNVNAAGGLWWVLSPTGNPVR